MKKILFTVVAIAGILLLAGCQTPNDPTPATYAVTVSPSGAETGESVSADVSEAAEGATVTLTAALSSGRQVALSASGVTIDPSTISTDSGTATFTMPAQAVEVTATFSSDMVTFGAEELYQQVMPVIITHLIGAQMALVGLDTMNLEKADLTNINGKIESITQVLRILYKDMSLLEEKIAQLSPADGETFSTTALEPIGSNLAQLDSGMQQIGQRLADRPGISASSLESLPPDCVSPNECQCVDGCCAGLT
jgi:hypothetical protein